jgi:hypothetical protein
MSTTPNDIADSCHIVLSSGRRFYVNLGVIGIDSEGNVYQGYDGSLFDWPGDIDDDEPAINERRPLTLDERRELSTIMIDRWQRFGANE